MKKPTSTICIISVLCLVISSLFTGCWGMLERTPLWLGGDAEPFTFNARAYDLAYYFDHVIETRASEFDLLLTSFDHFTVRIAGESLDGVTLAHSRADGWALRTLYHPPSANIRNIASIIVLSTSEDTHAVRFVDADEHVSTLTLGQLHMLDQTRTLRARTPSHLGERSATTYALHHRVPLGSVLEGDSFVAMARNGEAMFFRGTAYMIASRGVRMSRNQIDLLLPDDRVLHDLAGVMANPPGFLITDTFHDTMRFLEQGEQVLVIKLDGLGWNMLDHAPFLQSLQPKQALAVYPPVTPVALAAMLTGVTGDQNGIYARGQRELLAQDIFDATAQAGKTAVHISTRTTFINTSLAPVLARDDADAFMLAQQTLAEQPDLLFVHFKGIDDAAHAYGPHGEQTQQVIAEIDGFVRVLLEHFDGRVIITSDHGLHETDDGGNHGLFLPTDMLVPYVIR